MKNNILNKSILVPRNLEGRKETLRQHIIKLLSQDVIEGSLIIDKMFETIPLELIKLKEIKGHVSLRIMKGYIPSWLKNVKIEGSFECVDNKLTTLENCPQYISGSFWCSFNNLTSLEGCPKYIGGSFDCSYNKLETLEGCPKYIGGNLHCYNNNKVKFPLPKGIKLKGYLN